MNKYGGKNMDNSIITGVWKLCSFEFKSKDGTVFSPYGKDPKGFLIYDNNGYMSGMMSKSDRPNLSSEAINKIPEGEKSQLSDGFIAYSGKYEILKHKIIHHVEVSFIPNWIGMPLDRFYEFQDGKLILSMPPMSFNGKEYTGYIGWEKV
jgi:hypothetical protein